MCRTVIVLSLRSLLLRIQISYGPYEGRLHGSDDGGELHKMRMYDGDKIVRITGRRGIGPGAGIDQLTFYTKT
jgi:hypothetical protein